MSRFQKFPWRQYVGCGGVWERAAKSRYCVVDTVVKESLHSKESDESFRPFYIITCKKKKLFLHVSHLFLCWKYLKWKYKYCVPHEASEFILFLINFVTELKQLKLLHFALFHLNTDKWFVNRCSKPFLQIPPCT